MDRKQAQNVIGQKVVLEEGLEGTYIGELQEVIAEPRKPWRGKVKILAVKTFPDSIYEYGDVNIQIPKYKENDIVECAGLKLHTNDSNEEISSYSTSIITSIDKRINDLQNRSSLLELESRALVAYLQKQGLREKSSESTQEATQEDNEPFIKYSFHKKDKKFLLIDQNGEQLDLEECPFEFTWTDKNSEQTGYYIGEGSFENEHDKRFSPTEGETFLIDKKQFDPYFILRNELEPPALESLEKSLDAHGLTHSDLSHCHNSLLGQLLYSQGTSAFKGVNFLTYKGKQGVVMVQHHYERKLVDQGNDEIYDRFEFTTELGKRSIVTYQTNFYDKKDDSA